MLTFVGYISVKFVCWRKAYNIKCFTCTRLFNLSELSLSNIHAHEYWLYFFTNIFIGVFQYHVANQTLFKTLLYFVAKIYKKCLGPELLWMTSWDDWESSEEDGCQKDRGGNLHQKVLQDRACMGWSILELPWLRFILDMSPTPHSCLIGWDKIAKADGRVVDKFVVQPELRVVFTKYMNISSNKKFKNVTFPPN